MSKVHDMLQPKRRWSFCKLRENIHQPMDFYDAINEVLDRPGNIKLPGYRLDVVTVASRDFAKRGYCDSKFIVPIERMVRECVRDWNIAQKREIWESTETGAQSGRNFDDFTLDSIDLALEGELMYHVIEH